MTITNPEVTRLIEEQLNAGRYESADEVLLAGLKLLEQRENGRRQMNTPTTFASESGDLTTMFAEISKDVPDTEWAKLPRDLAENHDHYLYGTPKKP